MSEQHESAAAATSVPIGPRSRAIVIDLMAFLGVLAFAAGSVLLTDHTAQTDQRLTLAAIAGLVVACMTAWRRLRRAGPRRWRSGQAVYRGRRITVVSAWGAQGQPPPPLGPHVIHHKCGHKDALPTPPNSTGLELNGGAVHRAPPDRRRGLQTCPSGSET